MLLLEEVDNGLDWEITYLLNYVEYVYNNLCFHDVSYIPEVPTVVVGSSWS